MNRRVFLPLEPARARTGRSCPLRGSSGPPSRRRGLHAGCERPHHAAGKTRPMRGGREEKSKRLGRDSPSPPPTSERLCHRVGRGTGAAGPARARHRPPRVSVGAGPAGDQLVGYQQHWRDCGRHWQALVSGSRSERGRGSGCWPFCWRGPVVVEGGRERPRAKSSKRRQGHDEANS